MNEKTRRRLEMLERMVSPPEPLPEIVVCRLNPDGTRAEERRIRIEPLPELIGRP